ncbi:MULTISPECIES: hypothetical protein [unclassified Acidovorax]|uniref:hypothetical protein n=1 Tax=unclassified Acidovorax TaxID=2684926 RepID=UPI001C4584ED|nr:MULTISPECIES: hypothetical protein [unclassified Acidovorax]MBV7427031.1 hypothetical protein [Acidovorax sp. sif0732]MBV7448155.1 hypothetical protein [Acidovorax sp. sif0715]
MEYRLRPYFWLEHHPHIPQLTGGRPEGVMVEMVFAGDIQRLEFDGAQPFVTMVRTQDGRLLKTQPGFHIPLDELRFKREEIERAASKFRDRETMKKLDGPSSELPNADGGADEKLPFSVYVQEGELIDFAALPHIVAKAMYPADSDLDQYAVTRLNLDGELLDAVQQRELIVRSRSGMGEIKWAVPRLLEGGVLLPIELRPYLRKRGIKLVLLPHGSGPKYWTIENAAGAIAQQEGMHDEARGSLLDAMMDAANADDMTVRDPHTCLPSRPKLVRQFYELVTHEDVNSWLGRNDAPYRWMSEELANPVPQGPVVVMVDGRAALPVRSIPYITGWGLAPDEIAKNLARKTDAFARMQHTVAFHLVGDTSVKMQPVEWDAFAVKLDAFAAELRARLPDAEPADQRGYAEWRQKAVGLLPAGVFVWFDEFERDHRTDFSVDTVSFTDERGGERALNLAPYMDADTLAVVLEDFETCHQRQGAASTQPPSDDLIEFRAWCDATLNASDWWALSDLQPSEAAMLLCQQDPHAAPEPEKTTTSETTPLDYRKLLRAFEDLAKSQPGPRALSDWHQHARAGKLKYHGWIDRYASAMDQHGDMESEKEADSREMQCTPSAASSRTSGPHGEGITTAQVAAIFDALPYSAENWPKRLSDTKWLKPAQVALGAAGGATSLWCPAKLAELIHGREKGPAKQKTLEALNRRFRSNPALAPWRDDWDEHYAMFNDADEAP